MINKLRIILLGKKEDITVRYRFTTLCEAYESYPFKEEVSFSCFYSHIENTFKKPHRLTDLCEYCEHGKDMLREIKREAIKNKYESDGPFDSTHLLEYFQKLKHGYF